MRVAVTMTVRNEEQLIAANARFHRHIGVEKLFVYLDGSSDRTPAIVADLPGVSARPSLSADEARETLRAMEMISEDDVARITAELPLNHIARQTVNTNRAILDARAEGFDWLFHIDADEIICPDLQRATPDCLPRLLKRVPAAQVVFRTLEVVQNRSRYDDVVFAREHLFKTIFEPSTVNDMADMALVQRWLEYHPRPMPDPLTGTMLTSNGWLGHAHGKSGMRLSVRGFAANVHWFCGEGGVPLDAHKVLALLHYNTYSYDDFVKKYRQFTNLRDRWMESGPEVPYVPYRMWRDMMASDSYSESYLQDYFRKFVCFSEDELRALRAREPPGVIEVPAVADFFSG